MKKLLAGLALTVGFALLVPNKKVSAHQLTSDPNACSPHAQSGSDTGCSFSFCSYDGNWHRTYLCGCASQGAVNQCGASNLWAGGSSNSDDLHHVTFNSQGCNGGCP
jgi:hypothetical protein